MSYYVRQPTRMIWPPAPTALPFLVVDNILQLPCPPDHPHTVGNMMDEGIEDWVKYRWSGTEWVRWVCYEPDGDRHDFCAVDLGDEFTYSVPVH